MRGCERETKAGTMANWIISRQDKRSRGSAPAFIGRV